MRQVTSPPTRSGSRLVARTTTSGQAAQQGGGEPGARVQEMLAVVQDEQQPPLGQLPGQRDLGRPRLGQRHVQHRRDRLRHQLGTRQRRQLDDVDAVGIAVDQPGRGLVGQPGLARAARAGQGQQPGAAKRLADLGQLAPAADEGRLLRPQAFLDAVSAGELAASGCAAPSPRPRRLAAYPARSTASGEQVPVEPPGRRLGVSGVLLGQRLAESVEHRQGLVPTAARRQGRHQRPLRALVEGVGGGHRARDARPPGRARPASDSTSAYSTSRPRWRSRKASRGPSAQSSNRSSGSRSPRYSSAAAR